MILAELMQHEMYLFPYLLQHMKAEKIKKTIIIRVLISVGSFMPLYFVLFLAPPTLRDCESIQFLSICHIQYADEW